MAKSKRADSCDDCAIGTDGFGVLSDVLPSNDGPDADGQCNDSDLDDDNDGVPDMQDSDPSDLSVCQDRDGDGDTATTSPLDSDTDGVSDGDENLNKNGVVDNGETDPNNMSDEVISSGASGAGSAGGDGGAGGAGAGGTPSNELFVSGNGVLCNAELPGSANGNGWMALGLLGAALMVARRKQRGDAAR